MDEKEYKLKCETAKRIYQEFNRKLQKAIREHKWNEASDLSSYLSGMAQIMICFEYYDYDE